MKVFFDIRVCSGDHRGTRQDGGGRGGEGPINPQKREIYTIYRIRYKFAFFTSYSKYLTQKGRKSHFGIIAYSHAVCLG